MAPHHPQIERWLTGFSRGKWPAPLYVIAASQPCVTPRGLYHGFEWCPHPSSPTPKNKHLSPPSLEYYTGPRFSSYLCILVHCGFYQLAIPLLHSTSYQLVSLLCIVSLIDFSRYCIHCILSRTLSYFFFQCSYISCIQPISYLAKDRSICC